MKSQHNEIGLVTRPPDQQPRQPQQPMQQGGKPPGALWVQTFQCSAHSGLNILLTVDHAAIMLFLQIAF